MEGAAPALRIHYGDEIPMDPQMALVIINEFLDGIQHQWLNYNQGPKRFHNHGINPGHVIYCTSDQANSNPTLML